LEVGSQHYDNSFTYATSGPYTFTVSSANATAGATYTNNGYTYTVVTTISSGTSLLTTGTGAPTPTGTLTRATGTGDSTITFSYYTGSNWINFAGPSKTIPGVALDYAGNTLNVLVDGSTITVNGSNQLIVATNGVTNTQLAQMAANTLKGNNTGGTANAADLTVSQVNTMLGDVTTIGTYDSQTASAKGLVISGNSLYAQSASSSNPGMVNNSTQTMSGAKTFSTSVQSPIFQSNTANPAASGVVRLANTDKIAWRNAANSADISLFVDSSNYLETGGAGFIPTTDNSASLGDATNRWSSVQSLDYYFYGSTSGNVQIAAAATTTSYSLTLPGAAPTVTSVIQSTTGGVLSFVNTFQPQLTGSRGSPSAVTAAAGVAFTGNFFNNVWWVQGSGGAVTVTANPQIAAGTSIGQELILIGRSSTNTVTFQTGTGLSLAGIITLGADDSITLLWDGTNWLELCRNNG
jgi:hypothetical protein